MSGEGILCPVLNMNNNYQLITYSDASVTYKEYIQYPVDNTYNNIIVEARI